ncbi:LPS O-antigen chain length determinant protein WzzB [Limnobaculum xujianqingii]|uniref:LPS O-antigen chain length determinant protein WzzB n=1 Tax=Limnobaculum xujianqingii TaxID=2738837 RepID=UPI00112A24DB|nr:Wzz/FepE/Etk N-terminal domain-containing protein [Limnobaculum xujianqingii]
MSNKEQIQSHPQPVLSGYYPMYHATKTEEIDLFDLFVQLWKKKHWIVGCMLVTTLLSAVYAFTAKEQWTATAVVDVPNFDSMDNYYQGSRLLEGNVDRPTSSEEVANKLFKQFISQAGSYNELSKFISETNYFKKLVEGKNERDRANILNELIENVKLTKNQDNLIYTFSFSATTASEAKNLLEEYIDRVNANVSQVWYAQLMSQIKNKKQTLKNQMAAIKKVAEEQRQEEIKNIKMALTIAERTNIQKPEVTGLTQLDSNRLFLLGKDALSAMSESIEKQPLVLGDFYYDLQRQWINLDNFKVDSTDAKGFSYLKSPISPTNKDKPRKLLILVIGSLLGVCISVLFVFFNDAIKKRK